MKGPIIVPLDGSKLAEQAIPLALSIAQHIKTEVLLLQVISIPSFSIPISPDRVITIDEQVAISQGHTETYLGKIAQQLKKEGIPLLSYAIVLGRAGESIAQVADEREASYIVMSTHGRSGISRWILGSVATRVLHLTERPLLLMRPQQIHPFIPLELPEIKRIVVPLEGLPLAEQVLPHVKELAQAYSSVDIRLFYAIPSFPAGLAQLQALELKKRWLEISHQEAESYLGNLVSDLHAYGNNVSFAIKIGPPAIKIIEYAAEIDADLIMMTTHARKKLSRFLLGSVTDKVVQTSQMPVLVIRPVASTEEKS